MSFINKPKVAHPSLPTNALGMTRRQYEGSMSTLCAGCGHDSVTAAIVEACWGLDMRPEQLAKLSGIGCSSKTTAYFVERLARLQRGPWTHAFDRERRQRRESRSHLCGHFRRRRFAVHRLGTAGARDPAQRQHALPDREQRRLRTHQGSIFGVGGHRHQGQERRHQSEPADRSGVAGALPGRDLRRARLLRRQGAARAADPGRHAPSGLRPDRRAVSLRDLQRSRRVDQELHLHARALSSGHGSRLRAARARDLGRLSAGRGHSRGASRRQPGGVAQARCELRPRRPKRRLRLHREQAQARRIRHRSDPHRGERQDASFTP